MCAKLCVTPPSPVEKAVDGCGLKVDNSTIFYDLRSKIAGEAVD
jgi:hypothetical protein